MEANKALIRRWIETGLAVGDWSIIETVFAPEYAFSGMQGRDMLRASLVRMRAAFPDLHVTITDLIAEDDGVVARLSYRGTHRGTFMRIEPTGRSMQWEGVAFYRLAGGKIIAEWAIWDQTFPLQLREP